MENQNSLHLPASAQRLLGFLLSQRETWRSKKKLRSDDSWYGSNRHYCEVLGMPRCTLIRNKQLLKANGLIDYRTHQGRGKATDYWILDLAPATKPETPWFTYKMTPQQLQKLKDCERRFGKAYALLWGVEQGHNGDEVKAVLQA